MQANSPLYCNAHEFFVHRCCVATFVVNVSMDAGRCFGARTLTSRASDTIGQ